MANIVPFKDERGEGALDRAYRKVSQVSYVYHLLDKTIASLEVDNKCSMSEEDIVHLRRLRSNLFSQLEKGREQIKRLTGRS